MKRGLEEGRCSLLPNPPSHIPKAPEKEKNAPKWSLAPHLRRLRGSVCWLHAHSPSYWTQQRHPRDLGSLEDTRGSEQEVVANPLISTPQGWCETLVWSVISPQGRQTRDPANSTRTHTQISLALTLASQCWASDRSAAAASSRQGKQPQKHKGSRKGAAGSDSIQPLRDEQIQSRSPTTDDNFCSTGKGKNRRRRLSITMATGGRGRVDTGVRR